MSHHTSATDIGFDRRGEKRTPGPSDPYEEYQTVDRYQRQRFAKIDAYFKSVARGEPAGELLKAVLSEERGQ